MTRFSFVLAVAAMLCGMPLVPGHSEELQDKAAKMLMVRKLECAQKVLEGLAMNDFEKIGKHADELIRISKASEWRVLKTPQYEVHSHEFQRTAETLSKMADGKNLDGAALAYVELTLTCVKCHKHVREVRMARGK